MLCPIAVNENLPVIKPFKLCRKKAQTATTSATEFEHLDVLTLLEPGAPPCASKARPHPFQPLLSDKKVKKKKIIIEGSMVTDMQSQAQLYPYKPPQLSTQQFKGKPIS